MQNYSNTPGVRSSSSNPACKSNAISRHQQVKTSHLDNYIDAVNDLDKQHSQNSNELKTQSGNIFSDICIQNQLTDIHNNNNSYSCQHQLFNFKVLEDSSESLIEDKVNNIDAIVNKKFPIKFNVKTFNRTKEFSNIWPALTWNLWNISKSFTVLDNVLSISMSEDTQTHMHTSIGLFITKSELDMIQQYNENSTLFGRDNNQKRESMLMADFLFDVNNYQTNKKNYFYANNYRVIEGIAQLEKDTSWREFLYIDPVIAASNVSLDSIAPILWMLSPNSALQCRYSEYHTFRIQLKGSATYYLMSPEYYKYLYLYPSTHDSNYQSQVNFYDFNKNEDTFRAFTTNNINVTKVTLNAGEVLYIPPYYFTHMESVTTSDPSSSSSAVVMGLDVLSPSIEQLILLEAFSMNIPFKQLTNSLEERVIGAQIFLVHLLSHFPFVKSPKQTARSLYRSRFESLYPRSSLFLQRKSFDCFKDRQAEIGEKVLDKLNKPFLLKTIQHIADCVNDEGVGLAIKTMWLDDYISTIARWAMGNAEDSVLFIRECLLDFDKKIEISEEEVEGPAVIKIGD